MASQQGGLERLIFVNTPTSQSAYNFLYTLASNQCFMREGLILISLRINIPPLPLPPAPLEILGTVILVETQSKLW